MDLVSEHFKKHGYVHCFWLITLLSLFIAALLIRLPDASTLTNFVSFAATITSLFLGVIAIFLSIVSNQGLAGSIETMTKSAQRLEGVVDDVSGATERLEEHSKRVVEEARKIPEYFGSFRDELSSSIIYSQSRSTDAGVGGGVKLMTNVGAALGFYALTKAKSQGKAIDTELLRSEVSEYFGGIMFGFVSAVKAFSPCGVEIDLAGSAFTVRSMGNLDTKPVLDLDFAAQDLVTRISKWALDKQVGLADDDEKPTED